MATSEEYYQWIMAIRLSARSEEGKQAQTALCKDLWKETLQRIKKKWSGYIRPQDYERACGRALMLLIKELAKPTFFVNTQDNIYQAISKLLYRIIQSYNNFLEEIKELHPNFRPIRKGSNQGNKQGLRASFITTEDEETLESVDSETPEMVYDLKELEEKLKQCFKRLKNEERIALEPFDDKQLSEEEGDILAKSDGFPSYNAVKCRRTRARQKLNKCLQANLPEE